MIIVNRLAKARCKLFNRRKAVYETRLASVRIDASLMQDALIYHPGASAELKSLPLTLVRVNHQHNSCLLSITLKMLGKLRKKLRYFRKRERSDDTRENFHPANLSQKGKDRVVSESGKSRIEAARNASVDQPVNDTNHLNETPTEKNSKTRNPDQQDDVKCLEEAKHDGVDADVSPISKQHTKGTSLKEDREFGDPETGPKALHELKNDHKQDEAETPEYPVSKKTPADEKVVERSEKPGNVDLWQRAFDELNEDLKGQLREDEAISPENAIKEVIDRTKESFKAYQNGGLKFKKYDGKEVNVRDVAKKILNSAIHCSDIIKGIAAFDPSNHGK